MNDVYDFIGYRIAGLCERNNVTIKVLSKKLGKADGYVSSVISKRNKIPADVLMDVCDYFGISISEFFDETVIAPDLLKTAVDLLSDLEDKDLDALYVLMKRMPKQESKKV